MSEPSERVESMPTEVRVGAIVMSPTISEIVPALIKAQQVMTHAHLDSMNPHFKKPYPSLTSTLDASLPALNGEGIAVIQATSADGVAVMVTTMLAHTSGEYFADSLTMQAKDATPQPAGAVVTYGRRYTHAALCALGVEDDDGEAGQPDEQSDYEPSPPAQKTPEELMEQARRRFFHTWDKVMAETRWDPKLTTADELRERGRRAYLVSLTSGESWVEQFGEGDPHESFANMTAGMIDYAGAVLRKKFEGTVDWLSSGAYRGVEVSATDEATVPDETPVADGKDTKPGVSGCDPNREPSESAAAGDELNPVPRAPDDIPF